MRKREIVEYFTKDIIEKVRKNEIGPTQIASTLITAALSLSFVNEAPTQQAGCPTIRQDVSINKWY